MAKIASISEVVAKIRVEPIPPDRMPTGLSRLDPMPVGSGDAGRALTAPNAGVGVGVEYATAMDHFSVGADVMARFLIGPNIPTFAVFPRVKYTF